MTDDATPTHAEADPADALIAAYLEAIQAGTPADRAGLLADHPAVANELREFFADLDGFAAVAYPLRQDPAGTLPPDATLTDVRTPGRAFGDYELLEEIARGAMGVVYRARQRSLNRVVALKMILAGEIASPTEVQRFRAEAENAAALNHPNIVPIYEVGEHHGHHFYSMKLIEGGSLARFREPEPRLAPKEAARLVAAAARAVHYAHQRGILHRDLKPANILLDEDGQPQVADFGLAKRVAGGANATQPGAVVGTPAYMAPEQIDARGKPLTTAADVYGLGAVLYELLTGRPPFQAETVFETFAKVLHEEPVPPSRLAPGVARDLEAICLTCLAKEPTRRYGSTEALANDLERWLRGEPIAVRRAGLIERAVKWVRRRPAAAALAAVSTLAAVLLVVGPAVGVVLVGAAYEGARDARADLDRIYRREQLSSYLTKVAFAGREQQAGRSEYADRLLDECPDELRQWEWHYLKRLCCVPKTWRIDDVNFRTIDCSPDGRHVAMVHKARGLVVLDAATGEERVLPVRYRGPIRRVLFSGDGKSLGLLSDGADEGALLLCDPETGAERLSLAPSVGPRVKRAQFSRDGSRVMTCDDGAVSVWDAGTGRLLRQFAGCSEYLSHTSYGELLGPDGSRVFCFHSGEQEGVIWDVTSGKEVARRGDLLGDMDFTPDGERYLSWKRVHGWMALSDVATGRECWRSTIPTDGVHLAEIAGSPAARRFSGTTLPPDDLLGHGRWAMSQDGERIAVVANIWKGFNGSQTCLRDVRTGQVLYSIPGADEQVAFGPDGKLLAAAGSCGLKILDIATGRSLLTLRDTLADDNHIALTFGPDGRTLTAVSALPGRYVGSVVDANWRGVEVRHWDLRLASGATLLKGSIAVAFSPDSRQLAYASGDQPGNLMVQLCRDVKVIDLATGAELLCLKGHREDVGSIAFSGDGRRIATVGEGDGMKVWDAATGQELFARAEAMRGAAFLQGGMRVIAPVEKGVKVWDATSGRELLAFGEARLEGGLAVSPDGDLVATEQEDTGQVVLWDATTGERRCEVCKLQTRGRLGAGPVAFTQDGKPLAVSSRLCGIPQSSRRVAFTPDGKTLAVADGAVRLFDVDSGKDIGRIGAPTDAGNGVVAFSPDGRRLVSVPQTRPFLPTTLKVFDVATGREVASLFGHGSIVPSVAFSLDGNRIASASLTEVKVWDGTPLGAAPEPSHK
jgi:WD40 repeat protein